AGVVLGTDLVAHLSATVRGYGELARFRPGGVVDPDTGCCLAGPRGADLDLFGEHLAQHGIRIWDQRVCGTLHRAADSVRCGLPAEGCWPGRDVTGEAVGPLRREGHCAPCALPG